VKKNQPTTAADPVQEEVVSKRGVIPSRRRGISTVRALRSLASLGMTRFVVLGMTRFVVLAMTRFVVL